MPQLTQCTQKDYMPALEATGSWARSVRLARYQGRTAMTEHCHDDASLSVVIGGRYQERIRGRASEHGAGSLLFCPAFEPHAQQFSSAGAFQILIEPTPTALDFLGERLRLVDAPYAQSASVAELGLRIAAELGRADDFSPIIVHGLVLETFGLFFRQTERTAGDVPAWLLAVRSFIESHSSELLTIDGLARLAGRHPVHLSRAFRQAFGQTVGEWIRGTRLRHAARLLTSSRQPIGEIAVECGFCDQAHLSRSFRKALGITPGAYRRAAR
jgi:AraC family transcriptional regulator